jgi:hypothetical protein
MIKAMHCGLFIDFNDIQVTCRAREDNEVGVRCSD